MFWWGNVKERDNLEDAGVGEGVILEGNLSIL